MLDGCWLLLPSFTELFSSFFFSILFRDPPGRRLSCSFAVTQPWPWPVVQGLRNNSSRRWLRWLAGSAGSSSSSSSSPAVPFFFLLFFFFWIWFFFFVASPRHRRSLPCNQEVPPPLFLPLFSQSLSLSLSLFWYFFSQFLISFCWIFFGYVA